MGGCLKKFGGCLKKFGGCFDGLQELEYQRLSTEREELKKTVAKLKGFATVFLVVTQILALANARAFGRGGALGGRRWGFRS